MTIPQSQRENERTSIKIYVGRNFGIVIGNNYGTVRLVKKLIKRITDLDKRIKAIETSKVGA